jgi:undecaprenyl-diphosphatase
MDAFIFEKINSLALKNLWLDTLGIFLAEYFPYVLAICLILFFLVLNYKKYWPMVILALISGGLARGITEVIRFLWGRPRPFVNNHVNLLLDNINSKSFPSGHASFFFGLSTIVYFYNKKIGILFFIASFLISISRVYCAIHWPADILAGALVGIFSGILAFNIFEKLKK